MPKSLERLNELRTFFIDSEVILVTNDSTDATEILLKQWCSTSSGAHVLCLDGLAEALPFRADRLALVRNLYLAELMNRLNRGRTYDLLIVLDLDGVNNNVIDGEQISDAISSAPADWAGLFANQRQSYYDVWALRHKTWCPTDCWREVTSAAQSASRFAPRRPGRLKWWIYGRAHRRAQTRFVGKRQVQISTEEPPIEVESAFGGLGIYKTSWLADVWYGGRDGEGHEICEHVVLNQQIHKRGGKLYILPRLLNDAPVEHLHPGSGAIERPWAPSGTVD